MPLVCGNWHDGDTMKKSIFDTRRKDIARLKHINKLVLHLYDSARWPLDQEAHLATLTGDGLALAISVIESHLRGEPQFRSYAEQLAAAQK